MITRLAQHVLVVSALDARKIRQRRMRKSDRRIRLTRFAQQTFRCVEAARLETVRREPRDIAPRPAADVDRRSRPEVPRKERVHVVRRGLLASLLRVAGRHRRHTSASFVYPSRKLGALWKNR
jgi:hypothetical protein